MTIAIGGFTWDVNPELTRRPGIVSSTVASALQTLVRSATAGPLSQVETVLPENILLGQVPIWVMVAANFRPGGGDVPPEPPAAMHLTVVGADHPGEDADEGELGQVGTEA
jgi:hypothetical protein